VLILGEATSARNVATREALFEIVRELSACGSGVIFIPHRMGEIDKLGDRITVLRPGDSVATLSREQAPPRERVRLMTGAEQLTEGTAPPPAAGPRPRRQPVLRSVELRLRAGSRPIEVELCAGELVGLAGLEGRGQDRFLRALRGERVTVIGALIIITVLTTVLLGHGYGTGDQQIVFGAVILVAVAGCGRDPRLRDRV
jgi:ABC-type sugar transport system ATPase subunit